TREPNRLWIWSSLAYVGLMSLGKPWPRRAASLQVFCLSAILVSSSNRTRQIRYEVAPDSLEAMMSSPLEQDQSEQLFVQRLRQADPKRPAPDAAEQQVLDQIVAALGGVPLAIELTAAYIGKKQPDLTRLLADLQAAPLDAAALHHPKHGLRPCFDRV